MVVFVAMTILVGLRHDVGGDWDNYFNYLDAAEGLPAFVLVRQGDPSYWLVNGLSLSMDMGISGVNLICALIFSIGTVVFISTLPRPWLALTVAIPYLVIVVSMGYTRQSVALGLVMLGLVALRREKFMRFGMWVILAATFHKSAVLVLPLAVLTSKRNRLQAIGAVMAMAFFGYDAFIARHAEVLLDVYIENQRKGADGALIRLSMNALAAGLFLFFRKKFIMSEAENRLWTIFSLASLGMFVALFLVSFSTALDRMALYLIPLQLVVFSHLPDALGVRNGRNSAIVALIICYAVAVQFVWLNFASNAYAWLPYNVGFWEEANQFGPDAEFFEN